jgi:hypothetical protein
MIEISKKDIIWSYFAQFFSIISGIITLPLILKTLSEDEIGLNYLLVSFGSLVSLFDFGFSSQFGRNVSYIFGGAQSLKKEGVVICENPSTINYRLLATMIHTAKFVYRRIGLIVIAIMLTLGTYYVFKVTNGFISVKNSFVIWITFSFSMFFEIYYSYYSSLLIGKGMIMESRKALVYSRIVYVSLSFLFLYCGLGLFGIVLSNLIAPFVNRLISYNYFFSKEIKLKIEEFSISKVEIEELFKIVWFNSKKLGLVFIAGYAINKFSLFIAGLYLPLSVISSYGLMVQLVSIISTLSGTFFIINQSRFSALRVKGNEKLLLSEFAFTMFIYYFLFILGAIFILFICPVMLNIIGANAKLPSMIILFGYLIVVLLEGNHSNFAGFIVTKNDIPFVKSALIAGFAIVIGDYFSLAYTAHGIMGLLFVQGFAQLVYANWKWPHVVLREFGINFFTFLKIGFIETRVRLRI